MKLAIVEILDRDGSARRAVRVLSWPVTIGRGVDCDVVLDDPHVAAHHVTISESEGALSLEVGDSVNGAEWKGTRLRAGGSAVLPPGEVFQLGATRLRLRRPGDVLPQERALLPEPKAGRVPLPVWIAALMIWTVAAQWIATDPGAPLTDYVPAIVGIVLMLTMWCGLWALASKLFRQRFEFWPHTRIAVRYLMATQVLAIVLPLLAFMLGWTLLSRVAGLVGAAVTCAMIVAHLTRIVPTRRRTFAVVMGALYAAGVAVVLTVNYQTQDQIFGEKYVATLAPPGLRLASSVAPAQFIEEARALKARLDAHVKDEDGGTGGSPFGGVSLRPQR